MQYIPEQNTLVLTAGELSSYAYSRESANPSQGGFTQEYERFAASEEYVSLSCSVPLPDGVTVRFQTTVDAVGEYDGCYFVEVEKRQKRLPSRFNMAYNSEFSALGVINAYMFCTVRGEGAARLRLKFCERDGEKSVYFDKLYTYEQLSRLTGMLIERAKPFIGDFVSRKRVGTEEIKKLSFPYKNIRSGQQELMLGIMKTMRRGGKVLASAPTGTGKTMAALYPAIKAKGGGYIDRIFYLTAKTVTGKAACDAVRLLSERAPHLRCIMIHSKERTCPTGSLKEGCLTCAMMSQVTVRGAVLSVKQRMHEALAELMGCTNIYTEREISVCAEKHHLCPYELSLSLSELCDVIVCDYNYVFDSSIRFRRYFAVQRGEKYAFIVDEAHNLPDRVREMYSGRFSSAELSPLRELLSEESQFDAELGRAVSQCDEAFGELSGLCLENIRQYSDKKGEHTIGFYKDSASPQSIISSVGALSRILRERAASNPERREMFDRIRASAEGFCRSAASAQGTESVFFAELHDGDIKASVLCLDPSYAISDMCESAHASVMMSATLNPTDYFADVLGCSASPVIKAESPFDPCNLCVTVFDGVSTRLTDRKNTAAEVAEVISTVLESKRGNYFVFFPSYSYMRTVCRELLDMSPHVKAVMQKPNMSHKDREKFLSAFKSDKYDGIVGLCVLGGVFSEGVDLAGESLIGVIVVGAGLPGLSSELNLISEYYDSKYEAGRLYAYDYPAINRIEQAAGRVIRTAEDKGVVVMIDHRLSSPQFAHKFPDFWPQIASTSDTRTLSVLLHRFWDRHGDKFS